MTEDVNLEMRIRSAINDFRLVIISTIEDSRTE